jgi:hypothetical protein
MWIDSRAVVNWFHRELLLAQRELKTSFALWQNFIASLFSVYSSSAWWIDSGAVVNWFHRELLLTQRELKTSFSLWLVFLLLHFSVFVVIWLKTRKQTHPICLQAQLGELKTSFSLWQIFLSLRFLVSIQAQLGELTAELSLLQIFYNIDSHQQTQLGNLQENKKSLNFHKKFKDAKSARFHLNCRVYHTTAFLFRWVKRKVVSPSIPVYLPHSQGQVLWKTETALLVFTITIVTISAPFVNLFSAENCFFAIIFS